MTTLHQRLARATKAAERAMAACEERERLIAEIERREKDEGGTGPDT